MSEQKNNTTISTNDVLLEQQSEMSKTAYIKPALKAYGDVRDITLGSSIGVNESGCSGLDCLNNGPFS